MKILIASIASDGNRNPLLCTPEFVSDPDNEGLTPHRGDQRLTMCTLVCGPELPPGAESKGSAMSSPRRFSDMEIPHEIYEQESEIESIFQNRVRFQDSGRLHGSQNRLDDAPKHEVAAWIAIVVLGFGCIISFYLLWHRTL